MSPRSPQQFREIREEKMTLIMDVALKHFASEGYFRTTISHIARHARISKGLLYNYFESKEALLKAIIHRSVNEIYRYFDIDKDGALSEEEFEFFIRKINELLKEKRSFWQLLMQLLVQNDVREEFLKSYPESDSLVHPGHEPGDNIYPSLIIKMFRDYFYRKKKKMGKQYDPARDLELFYFTLFGYAMKIIYLERADEESDEKAINRIIEFFK
jgi:AcrR family transcriptional regulator